MQLPLNPLRMALQLPQETSRPQKVGTSSAIWEQIVLSDVGKTSRQNARNLFTGRNERERDAGGPPSLPRCLGCGKFVFGKPRW
jgi:hypothetical protein